MLLVTVNLKLSMCTLSTIRESTGLAPLTLNAGDRKEVSGRVVFCTFRPIYPKEKILREWSITISPRAWNFFVFLLSVEQS